MNRTVIVTDHSVHHIVLLKIIYTLYAVYNIRYYIQFGDIGTYNNQCAFSRNSFFIQFFNNYIPVVVLPRIVPIYNSNHNIIVCEDELIIYGKIKKILQLFRSGVQVKLGL